MYLWCWKSRSIYTTIAVYVTVVRFVVLQMAIVGLAPVYVTSVTESKAIFYKLVHFFSFRFWQYNLLGYQICQFSINADSPGKRIPKDEAKNPTLKCHFTQNQACQMVYFQTKNTNLGKFSSVLQWKMLVYFIAICNIFQKFSIHILWYLGIFCGHLVNCTTKNLATLLKIDWKRGFCVVNIRGQFFTGGLGRKCLGAKQYLARREFFPYARNCPQVLSPSAALLNIFRLVWKPKVW
jgi:hypothetical protein